MNNKENDIFNQTNSSNPEQIVNPVNEIVNPEPPVDQVNVGMVNSELTVNPVNVGMVNSEPAVNPVNVEMVNPKPSVNPVNVGMVNSEPTVNPVNVGMVNSEPTVNPVNTDVLNPELTVTPVNTGVLNPEQVVNPVNVDMMSNKNSVSLNGMTRKNNKVLIVVIVVVILIAALLVLNFFNTKTLSCSMNETTSGMTLKSDFNIVYRGKNVNKMKMTMEVNLGDYADYKDMMFEKLETEYRDKIDEINDNGGKASLTSNDDSIFLEISASRNGISTMLPIDDENYSYKDMKSELEDIGYTCK